MNRMLRRARPDDLDAIMALERSIFTDDAWPVDAMRRELENPYGYYLVAVDLDEPQVVLGYAGLLAPAEQGDVQTIAVTPDARGSGLGRALMDALLAEARRIGLDAVFLEVRADNPIAIALYESLGFVEIGVRPRYYRRGVDAIAMRLEVTPAVTRPAGDGSLQRARRADAGDAAGGAS